MPTAKKQALEMVRKLPDKATWDDIMYGVYVRKKIEAGIQAADEGRVVSHEDVKKRFVKKMTRLNGPNPPLLMSKTFKTTLRKTQPNMPTR